MTVVDIRRVSTNLSFTCLGNLLAHKCKHEPVCTRVVVVLVLVEEVQGVDGSRLQGLAPPDVPSRLCQILRDGSGVQLTSYSATPVQCRRAVLQALRHSGNSLKKYWKIQKNLNQDRKFRPSLWRYKWMQKALKLSLRSHWLLLYR